MSHHDLPLPHAPAHRIHPQLPPHPLHQNAHDDLKYQSRYRDLKAKLRDLEQDNDALFLKTVKAKRNIQRLRLERAILYEKLGTASDPHVLPHAAVPHHPHQPRAQAQAYQLHATNAQLLPHPAGHASSSSAAYRDRDTRPTIYDYPPHPSDPPRAPHRDSYREHTASLPKLHPIDTFNPRDASGSSAAGSSAHTAHAASPTGHPHSSPATATARARDREQLLPVQQVRDSYDNERERRREMQRESAARSRNGASYDRERSPRREKSVEWDSRRTRDNGVDTDAPRDGPPSPRSAVEPTAMHSGPSPVIPVQVSTEHQRNMSNDADVEMQPDQGRPQE